MPRPRGGDWLDEEIRGWQQRGVTIVVSLLESEEIAALDLNDEQHLAEAAGIRFLRLPIPDRGVPTSREPIDKLLPLLSEELAKGGHVAIHCRQGIGRAALVAIALLVWSGVSVESATQQVSEARGCSVPETREQQQWLSAFARSRPALLRS